MAKAADELTIIRTRLQQQVVPNMVNMLTELQAQGGQLADLIAAVGAQVNITSGEWAPTVLGATTAGATTYNANGQVGRYRKVGDAVYFGGRVDWSAATGTGNLRISLPLTSANITNMRWVVDISDAFLTWPTGSAPIGIIIPNTSYVELQCRVSGAAPNLVQMDANGAIGFSGWYIAA